MKKKIAVIIPSLRGGGAEKVMINVISNLDRNIFDITLIVLKKEGPYISLLPEDIEVLDLNTSRVRYSIKKLIKIINYLESDIVLSTLGHLNLALIAIKPFLLSNPKVVVREGNTPSKDLNNLSGIKKVVIKFLYKILYDRSDCIIAQCEDMKKDILKCCNIKNNNIVYIYNPVDVKKIKEKMTEFNPYNDKNINLISVGRLAHQKGFDILIDAFKIVNKKIPNTHLTILGEGDLKEQLNMKALELNLDQNISFVDFKRNPYPYYYYSDLYILTSRWEGFPNTLLEALACETKIVAVDCKSGPREILKDGIYGVLSEENNPVELANNVIKYINDKNKTKDRANYFSIDKIIKEYERVLLE